MLNFRFVFFCLGLAFALSYCNSASAIQVTDKPGLPSAAEQQVVEKTITGAALRGSIRFLADDLLEGRGPGTRGDDLAMRYITSQFESMGLKPAAPDGGWIQDVPLVGVTTRPPPYLTFRAGDQSLTLKNHEDYIASSGRATEEFGFDNVEVVFVGYGIQAPEYKWDDFKDVDVRGKILLMMNNDPSTDPEMFGGSARLYYGRWDYKYAKAAEMGAIGAMIIHTTPSASYPYQVVQTSWTGEQMDLAGNDDQNLPLKGWLTEESSRKLAKLAGKDLDELRKQAESRDFKPVPLGTSMSIALKSLIRETKTGNVLGLLEGSDPELSKEWVVFMAHHDHLGMSEKRDQSVDNIYNGAIDNASGGGSLLAIARAITSLPESERPKRSILFASVGAEEQGLLGSQYLALHPPIPAGRLACVINIDGINILGRTKDVVVIGKGKSNLDDIVMRIAMMQDRVVVGDQFPDHGSYYRSDQFSLAKIGVPGVYLSSGVHVIGQPEGWGKEKLREWNDTIYHQPSDEYSDSWNLEGAVEDVKLLCYVGLQVADNPKMPAWNQGDEFEAARLAALRALQDK